MPVPTDSANPDGSYTEEKWKPAISSVEWSSGNYSKSEAHDCCLWIATAADSRKSLQSLSSKAALFFHFRECRQR